MSAPYHRNLEMIVIDWIGAMRRRDLDAVAELLDPAVEQRWVDGQVYCANREQMLAWMAGRPDRAEYRIDAVEVVAGDAQHVVMSVRGPDLERVGGEHVGGQVCGVFTIRDGRVVAIRQYLHRAEALDAAGIEPGAAAWR